MTPRFRFRVHLIIGALALVMPLLPPSQTALAAPTTRWVDDNVALATAPGSSCQSPGYRTIQAAVDVSGPGDRINVCPGTYPEQVVLSGAMKNDLQLRSVNTWQAVIKAPTTSLVDPKAIVRVTGSRNVTIVAFTITGPGSGGCDSLDYGVRVDGVGQANIFGNHITEIHGTPNTCEHGVGVEVGNQAAGETGSAKVLGNWIEKYQTVGVRVSNANSFANVTANRIVGVGTTVPNAQNGVEVNGNATARIEQNAVANNLSGAPATASTGVLLFNSGVVTTNNNTVAANDVGVYMINPAATSQTSGNRVRSSTFDGVALFPANRHSVRSNDTEQNHGPGIGVYDSQNSTLDGNDVDRNTKSGILLDNADTNTVHANEIRDNGTNSGDTTDGLQVFATSTGNTIQSNSLRNNLTHDCHDDSVGIRTAGTDNTWTDNRGQTQNKTGLCRPSTQQESSADDSTFQTTASASGWNPSYSWYATEPLALDYDWVTAYSVIDVQSLLDLLPRVGVTGPRPPSPRP